eukprot:scaffold7381_cov310-Pinguiococcus_pyrenoidosus.AAC.119
MRCARKIHRIASSAIPSMMTLPAGRRAASEQLAEDDEGIALCQPVPRPRERAAYVKQHLQNLPGAQASYEQAALEMQRSVYGGRMPRTCPSPGRSERSRR